MNEPPTKEGQNTATNNQPSAEATRKPEPAPDPLATPTEGSMAMKVDVPTQPGNVLDPLATPTEGLVGTRFEVKTPPKSTEAESPPKGKK